MIFSQNEEVSLASMSFEEKEAMTTYMHLRDTLCSVNGKQSHKTAILVQLYEFPPAVTWLTVHRWIEVKIKY